MKKNLAMSIALLALAVLTCCGVTFAYFSTEMDGTKNNINVGNFVFDSETTIINSGEFNFRAATIINFPQITDPTPPAPLADSATQAQKDAYNLAFAAYQVAHNNFLTQGDDQNFNAYVVPITIKATNKSDTPMRFTAKITAAAVAGAPDATTAFNSFVFANSLDSANPSKDAYLTAINDNNYSSAMRLVCPNTSGENAYEQTKINLQAGKTLMDTQIYSSIVAAQVSSGTPEVITQSSIQLKAILWLDYRAYKNLTSSQLQISVTVTATQANKEGGRK